MRAPAWGALGLLEFGNEVNAVSEVAFDDFGADTVDHQVDRAAEIFDCPTVFILFAEARDHAARVFHVAVNRDAMRLGVGDFDSGAIIDVRPAETVEVGDHVVGFLDVCQAGLEDFLGRDGGGGFGVGSVQRIDPLKAVPRANLLVELADFHGFGRENTRPGDVDYFLVQCLNPLLCSAFSRYLLMGDGQNKSLTS